MYTEEESPLNVSDIFSAFALSLIESDTQFQETSGVAQEGSQQI